MEQDGEEGSDDAEPSRGGGDVCRDTDGRESERYYGKDRREHCEEDRRRG